MWKNIRVAGLLIVLAVVAVNAWRDMHQDWSKSITVLLHPINADHRPATAHYIQQLSIDDLTEMQRYLQRQSQQFRGQPIQFNFELGRELKQIPPKVPENSTLLNTVWWSLKFRYYAWKQHQSEDASPSVTLYLNYYDPRYIQQLKHSVALERGRIGSVNLFASQKQSGSNNVVIVHELLHAFGAKDKYDLNTGQPIYPLGYADPDQDPLYPQKRAEIMGGYIPLSESKSQTPDSLSKTMLSRSTAQEMEWVK